jgi:CRISPR-associated endonuclease/helicase Cas3
MQLRSVLDGVLQPPDYSLQRHELLDFFDTDSNLSLGYTDVSPFVRGVDAETDVYVLWRDWDGDYPPYDFDVGRHEICRVPIWHVVGRGELKAWREYRKGFIWQGRERGWQPASEATLHAGATLLMPGDAGGYDETLGWTGTGERNTPVTDLYEPADRPTDEELLSALEQGWQSIAAHTLDVRLCWEIIRSRLNLGDPQVLAAIDEAIRWHDYGKAIEKWQDATRRVAAEAGLIWPEAIAPVGKFSIRESPALRELIGPELQRTIQRLKRTFVPDVRHEVASALALRQRHRQNGREPTLYDCLAEYLVMAHHGHVRKVLRDELPRDPGRLRRGPDEVRGVREGTPVPGFSANGDAWPATDSISIACRQMGRSPDGLESWTRTVLRLLDQFGPFRLAYYEALVRAADWRASKEPRTDVAIASPRVVGKALVSDCEGGAKQ